LSASTSQRLADALAAGATWMGELHIAGEYELRHHLDADAPADSLTVFNDPGAAREIALYDAAGNYRPLRTAPTLKRGWRITLSSIGQLHDALDAFYPAMLAARLALDQGRLAVTPLRDTLNRQSGMYAITRKITDPQADALIGDFCRSDCACLKTILWPIASGISITSLPPGKLSHSPDPTILPLLCAEACNLLVAKAREVVKQGGS
jgi:sirohydrochlorin cobaltochelatase